MLQSDENSFASLVIGRLAQKYGFASDTALAAHLGVTRQTVGNWRSRDTLDYKLLLDTFQDADLNWLFRGSEARSAPPSSGGPHSLADCLKAVLDSGYRVERVREDHPITPET